MKFLKKIAATLITLLILLIALVVFFNDINTLSIPEDYTQLRIPDIKTQVKIYQTSMGIKHIVAGNENDAYLSLGYIHSLDRLFQMDLKRRIAYGQLSEIFGKDFIDIDKFLRTLNIDELSDTIMASMDKKTLLVLNSYSKGVNSFIEQNKNKLPFGFAVLDYLPDQWTATDCIAIQRLFAFEQSIAFKADLIFGMIADKVGPEKALKLLPGYPAHAPCILDSKPLSFYNENMYSSNNTKTNNNFHNYHSISKFQTFDLVQKVFEELSNRTGVDLRLAGCNVWAVKKKSADKTSAIVANDFHSNLQLPATWYQIHLSYQKTDLIGFTLPGMPFVIAGRNSSIAWGISNSMLDDCDFFIEKLSKDKNYYINEKGDSLKFRYVKDTIKVKKVEDYVYYKQFAGKSVILPNIYGIENDYKNPIADSSIKFDISSKYLLTFNWVGQTESDEFKSLLNISKSSNWNEFKESLKHWGSPALNFVYGDTKGNIGLVSCGYYPLRGESANMVLPNPGWIEGQRWQGVDKSGIVGYLYNPEKGYVSAANNLLSRTTVFSNYYDLPYRSLRIDTLVNQYRGAINYELSYLDAQRMQMDVVSDFARDIIYQVTDDLSRNQKNLNAIEKKAFYYLRNWDLLVSQNKIQPSIFNMFIKRLIDNIFSDEIGKVNLKNYMYYKSFSYGKVLEVLNDRYSAFYDNIKTSEQETRSYNIVVSFKQAIAELVELYGTDDITKWDYTKMHKIKLSSIFDGYFLLEQVSKLSEISTGGDNTTLNFSDWDENYPFAVKSTSSFRFIADLSDSVVHLSIPGGVSGEPMSPHYGNQLHLWENGGYIRLPIKPVVSNQNKLFMLIN